MEDENTQKFFTSNKSGTFATPAPVNPSSNQRFTSNNTSYLSGNNREIITYNEYYKSGIRDAGEEGRKASRVLFLRSFNNWIKAVLINKYCRGLGSNLSVLDLCCGRGGDLKKYCSTKVKLYVGADLSEESLKNAMERVKKIKNEKYEKTFPCKCFFIPEDISDPSNHLMEKIDKAYYFDLVSCQFAMHYHFESEIKIRTFLTNVVSRLCEGGYFIGSIIDDNILVKRLRNRKTKDNKYINEKLTFGNEFYSIKFNSKHFPKDKGPYGIQYGFYLEDSIDKRDIEGNIKYVGEYIVVFSEFVKLCEEYDLHLVERKNFTDFYQENVNNFYYKNIFNKMIKEVNNPSKYQQWEIIQLYQIFAFRKGKKEFSYEVPESKGRRGKYNNSEESVPQEQKTTTGEKYIPYLYKSNISFKDFEPVFTENTFE